LVGDGFEGAGVDGLGLVGDGLALSLLPHPTASIAVRITHDNAVRFINNTTCLTVGIAMSVPGG